MNAQEITEVRRTWELASTCLPLLSRLFCARMELIARHHGPLFGDDAETSARLILRLVGIAVNGLNQPRILFPVLNTLGAQNARRIVDARQNWVVIHALLCALKAALGPSFNSSVRHAWIACYRAVRQAMEAGIAEAASGNRWTAFHEVHPMAVGRLAVNLIRHSTVPVYSATQLCNISP